MDQQINNAVSEAGQAEQQTVRAWIDPSVKVTGLDEALSGGPTFGFDGLTSYVS